MALPTDTPQDADELQHELDRSLAIHAYEKMIATAPLDSAEDTARKLRIQLASVEPLYETRGRDCALYKEHVTEQEALLEAAAEDIRQCLAQVRALNDENASLKGALKDSEDRCTALRDGNQTSTAELLCEKDTIAKELQNQRVKTQKAVEKNKALEKDLKSARGALFDADAEMRKKTEEMMAESEATIRTLRSELEETQSALHKSQHSKANLENLSLELDEAKRKTDSWKLANETEKGKHTQTLDSLKKSQEAIKELKAELSELRPQLKAETKAREKAQKEHTKAQEQWDNRQQVLQRKLENLQAKLKAAQTTTVPTDNPRKRSAFQTGNLTIQDLERSSKKPRQKTPPKTSEFSLTPHLKKQSRMLADSGGDETAVEDAGSRDSAGVGDISMIQSGAPARLLLAGAHRKSSKPPATSSEPSEAAMAAIAEEEAAEPEQEQEEEEEDSMIMMAPPPKYKPSARAKKPAPQLKKRKKQDPDASIAGGIRPTFFDDDGTGRLHVNLDDASQEPKGAAAPKNKNKLGNAKLPPPLPVTSSAFGGEISPPKKRPEALKMRKFVFGVKKK